MPQCHPSFYAYDVRPCKIVCCCGRIVCTNLLKLQFYWLWVHIRDSLLDLPSDPESFVFGAAAKQYKHAANILRLKTTMPNYTIIYLDAGQKTTMLSTKLKVNSSLHLTKVLFSTSSCAYFPDVRIIHTTEASAEVTTVAARRTDSGDR